MVKRGNGWDGGALAGCPDARPPIRNKAKLTKTSERLILSSRLLILGPLLLSRRAGPAGFDCGSDSASGAELAAHQGPDRVAGFDHVLQDLVDDVLLEDS